MPSLIIALFTVTITLIVRSHTKSINSINALLAPILQTFCHVGSLYCWKFLSSASQFSFSKIFCGAFYSKNLVYPSKNIPNGLSIELDWIEEYQWVDPPRLWEAVSGEGCIHMWSHFQLDSSFSPRPCTKVMEKKARWQPPIFVSCLLIGPNGLTPLFRSSSMGLKLAWPFSSMVCEI